MGLGRIHKQEFNMKLTCTIKQRRWLMQVGSPGSSISCLFVFSTKVLNIWDFHTSATPKMGIHLEIVGLNLLHSPSLVRMCFIPTHTLLASCALHSTFSCEPNVKVVTSWVKHYFYHFTKIKWNFIINEK
jgi:hypothetical protein